MIDATNHKDVPMIALTERIDAANFQLLTLEWRDLSVAAPSSAASACQIEACLGLTYAELRSPSMRLNVCFKHYEAARTKAA